MNNYSANKLMKPYKKYKGNLKNSHKKIQYTKYRPPKAGKSCWYIKSGLDPLIISLQEEIIGKECERCLKAEEIAAALARQTRSSMDQNNFEIHDLKIKLVAWK